MFETHGVVVVDGDKYSEDDLIIAIDAGASDVVEDEGKLRVLAEPTDLTAVKEALAAEGIEMESVGLAVEPTSTVEVEESEAGTLIKLLEAIEDQDDVNEVHANFDIPDEVLGAHRGLIGLPRRRTKPGFKQSWCFCPLKVLTVLNKAGISLTGKFLFGGLEGIRRHVQNALLMRVVMGIDPGTANLGFGVVRIEGGHMVALDGGVIETNAGQALEHRLAHIHGSLIELLDWHQPSALAIEDIYFGKNVSSAMKVGQASGVVMLAAAQRGVECFAYTPQAIKVAVCGSGEAAKRQVQKMVATLLDLTEMPRPDHAADALAVAICHGGTAGRRDAEEAARKKSAAAQGEPPVRVPS